MKKAVASLIVMLMLLHANSYILAETLSKSGDCKLSVNEKLDKDKMFTVALKNNEIIAKCEFYGGTFFGEFTLFAIPTITNHTEEKIEVDYKVSFFDAVGNSIASISQQGSIKDKDIRFASSLTSISEKDLKKIASYKITINTN